MSAKKEPKIKPPSWGLFPPYGFMDLGALPFVKSTLPPTDWKGSPESYHKWFSATLEVIQECLWPVFDRGSRSWKGAASARMEELTIQDLNLLRMWYRDYPNRIEQPVHAPNGLFPLKSHHEMQSLEDLRVSNWGTAHTTYDQSWTDAQIKLMGGIILSGMTSKMGGSLYQFKDKLQRPRPYQMAMILGYDDFTCLEALSANTPSMCSGHCGQGLMFVGAVMERLILGGSSLTDGNWSALKQFAVDIGDRRVMARVHYPSDSLCSFLIVMRMADHIFGSPEVKKRLWSAITNHSAVYKLIRSAGDDSVYAPR